MLLFHFFLLLQAHKQIASQMVLVVSDVATVVGGNQTVLGAIVEQEKIAAVDGSQTVLAVNAARVITVGKIVSLMVLAARAATDLCNVGAD